jgi:uncharacterized protein (UPF0216 family)
MAEREEIDVTCESCWKNYRFTRKELEGLQQAVTGTKKERLKFQS